MSEAMALWLKLNLSHIRNKDLFLCVGIILNSKNQYQPYKGNANNFILQWPETSRIWSHDVFMVYLELTITHFQTDRQTDTQPSKPFQITSASTSTLAWCMCICFVCKFAFHSFWYFTPTLRKQIKMWLGINSKVAKLRKEEEKKKFWPCNVHFPTQGKQWTFQMLSVLVGGWKPKWLYCSDTVNPDPVSTILLTGGNHRILNFK